MIFCIDIRSQLIFVPEWLVNKIDWMIEVLSSFNCTPNTFFVAIDIMDSYLQKTTSVLDTKNIHLIGVTSMLLASKMEEIIPFKVSTVVEKMTHGKMSTQEIVACETDILVTLNFKLLEQPSLLVLVEFLLVKLGFHDHVLNEDVNKVIIYITKMLMHDYSLITKYPLKYLAASCIYICFKIIEQVNRDFKTKIYVEKLKVILDLNEQTFYASSESLLALAKNFEKTFSYAKNLLKFDSFSLDKDEKLY